jgi:hypothetical protein
MPHRNPEVKNLPVMAALRADQSRAGSVQRSWWIPVLTILLALGSFTLTMDTLWQPPVAVAGEDLAGSLYLVRWRAGAWGEKATGTACWLSDGINYLRCEVRRDDGDFTATDVALDALQRQLGEGWTLTAAGPRAGTLHAWGEGWQEVNHDLLQWGRVLTQALVKPHTDIAWLDSVAARKLPDLSKALPRPRWLRTQSQPDLKQPDLRLEITMVSTASEQSDEAARAGAGSSYRRRLERRGRGRGAAAEIVDLRWPTEPDSRGLRWIQITSSRRPGRLEITVPIENIVTYPVPETFLPLWTLADLLGAGSHSPADQEN